MPKINSVLTFLASILLVCYIVFFLYQCVRIDRFHKEFEMHFGYRMNRIRNSLNWEDTLDQVVGQYATISQHNENVKIFINRKAMDIYFEIIKDKVAEGLMNTQTEGQIALNVDTLTNIPPYYRKMVDLDNVVSLINEKFKEGKYAKYHIKLFKTLNSNVFRYQINLL